MTKTDIILYICSVLCSIALGANMGFARGIKKGIEIAMETAITETIKHLNDEFKKLGEDDHNKFKNIVNKVFDRKKLNLWEEEE